MDLLSDTLDLSDFASRVVQPLMRCLEASPELRPVAVETLASLVAQLGRKYLIFVPMAQKVMLRHRIQHTRYDVLVAKILNVRPRARSSPSFLVPLSTICGSFSSQAPFF